MSSLSATEILRILVGFDTVSRNSNMALLLWIEDYLGQFDIPVDLFPNEDGSKANLFATIGPAIDGGVVLSGHTDVVPVDGQAWSNDPFTLVERDGKLFGRGTCDMKGFIALALAAVPQMMEKPLTSPIHFAFSYDEEVGCVGVHSLIDWLADSAPVKPAAVIVGEPTMMKVINAHKGICSFVTEIKGVEAHSSRPDLGVNAAIAGAEIVMEIARLSETVKENRDHRFHPDHTTFNIGRLEAGTAVNIIPNACEIRWEFRPIPGDDPDMIIDKINRFCFDDLLPRLKGQHDAANITIETKSRTRGLAPEAQNRAEEIALNLTGENDTGAVSYATEAGLFQGIGLSSVVCGPGSIEQAHKPDEYVSVAQMEAGAAFIRQLVIDQQA